MTALARWETMNPLAELDELANRFNRMLSRFQPRQGTSDETMAVADWIPTVDVEEDDKEYLIKAEIPEVDKNDVKVTVENGVLTISGERRHEEKKGNGKRLRRIERMYGAFVRSFTLPEDADEQNVRAEFKNGMLLIHLPKTQRRERQTREVPIE